MQIDEGRRLADIDGHGRDGRLRPLVARADPVQVQAMDDEAAGAAVTNARAVVDEAGNGAAEFLEVRHAAPGEILPADGGDVDRGRQRGRLAAGGGDDDIRQPALRPAAVIGIDGGGAIPLCLGL